MLTIKSAPADRSNGHVSTRVSSLLVDFTNRADFGLDVVGAMLGWRDVRAAGKFAVNVSEHVVTVGSGNSDHCHPAACREQNDLEFAHRPGSSVRFDTCSGCGPTPAGRRTRSAIHFAHRPASSGVTPVPGTSEISVGWPSTV